MIHRGGVGPGCWTVSADDCTTFLSQAVLTVLLLILWFPSWFWVYLIGRYWHHKGLLKPSSWHCEVPEGMDCCYTYWFYNKSPVIIRQSSDPESVFQGNTWATRVVVVVSHSVMSDSSWHHGLQHARLPCPSLFPRVCSNSHPLNQWCHPAIPFFAIPFSCCTQSFSQQQGLF